MHTHNVYITYTHTQAHMQNLWNWYGYPQEVYRQKGLNLAFKDSFGQSLHLLVCPKVLGSMQYLWNRCYSISTMLFSFEGIILESVSLVLREIKQFGKKHRETWLEFLYASLRQNFLQQCSLLTSWQLALNDFFFPLELFILLWLDWTVFFGAEVHHHLFSFSLSLLFF